MVSFAVSAVGFIVLFGAVISFVLFSTSSTFVLVVAPVCVMPVFLAVVALVDVELWGKLLHPDSLIVDEESILQAAVC